MIIGISVAIIVIIAIGAVVLYNPNLEPSEKTETNTPPQQESKKFTVDLSENVGLKEP